MTDWLLHMGLSSTKFESKCPNVLLQVIADGCMVTVALYPVWVENVPEPPSVHIDGIWAGIPQVLSLEQGVSLTVTGCFVNVRSLDSIMSKC